jgi:hypothetical protein
MVQLTLKVFNNVLEFDSGNKVVLTAPHNTAVDHLASGLVELLTMVAPNLDQTGKIIRVHSIPGEEGGLINKCPPLEHTERYKKPGDGESLESTTLFMAELESFR